MNERWSGSRVRIVCISWLGRGRGRRRGRTGGRSDGRKLHRCWWRTRTSRASMYLCNPTDSWIITAFGPTSHISEDGLEDSTDAINTFIILIIATALLVTKALDMTIGDNVTTVLR